MAHSNAVIETRWITARVIAIAAPIMIAARYASIERSVHKPVGLGTGRASTDTDPKLSTVSEWLADGLTHADAVSAIAGTNVALADLLLAGVAPRTESKARRFHRVAAGNPDPAHPPTPAEDTIMDGLGRAGIRLMGFCKTNLFKRLESGGPAFVQSLQRHIMRNLVYLHALENEFPARSGSAL